MNWFAEMCADILKRTFAVIGLLMAIITPLCLFVPPIKRVIEGLGWPGFAILVLLAYAGAATYHIITLLRSGHYRLKRNQEIVALVQHLIKEGRNQEAVKVAVTVQRALWVTGRWVELARTGEVIKNIAKGRELLVVLVDMIGWPSEAIGQSHTAEVSLHIAITEARLQGDMYYLAKAQRHMAGVRYRCERWLDAETCLSEAEQTAQAIGDTQTREEMLAGIHYGRAFVFLGKHDYDRALETNLKASLFYEQSHDRSRNLKVLTQRALVLFEKGKAQHQEYDIFKARVIFEDALRQAQEIRRQEQIAECHEGLGDISLHTGKHRDARKYYKECLRTVLEIGPDVVSTRRIRAKLKKL